MGDENKKPLETRSFCFDVRAINDEKRGAIITGQPVVYGDTYDCGDWDEVIDRGALDGTDLTDVRFLVNHNTKMIPLARSRRNNGNSTMQLTANESGLILDWVSLDVENNGEARALYSAVQRGDISGMSFMFSISEERWDGLDTEKPTRHIMKIGSIVEVSAVTFPAYEATTINARDKAALESARLSLESAKQERAATLESVRNTLELEKAKFEFLTKI